MQWDFPFPLLPRVVKESLFLEKKKGGSVAAKELVSCPCVSAPWTGQGHRHALPFPSALTNSISPKPCAKVPAPLPLTLESGKKELLYPRAVKWIPESGFMLIICVTVSFGLKHCLQFPLTQMHGAETNGRKILHSEEGFVRDAGPHVAISGF